MEESHKTHRPHIKVGKYEEKKKEEEDGINIDNTVPPITVKNVLCCRPAQCDFRRNRGTADTIFAIGPREYPHNPLGVNTTAFGRKLTLF